MQTHSTVHHLALTANEVNFCDSIDQVDPTALNEATVADVWIASLRVLAFTLLKEIQDLDDEMTSDNVQTFNLHTEVRRFEISLIRSALLTTGGRQRRAAKLLGMKITTLNTKVKKLGIDLRVRDSKEA